MSVDDDCVLKGIVLVFRAGRNKKSGHSDMPLTTVTASFEDSERF